jgi:hypothetical protein
LIANVVLLVATIMSCRVILRDFKRLREIAREQETRLKMHSGCHHVRVFSDPPKSVSELVTYVPSTLSSWSKDCCHVLSMFPL